MTSTVSATIDRFFAQFPTVTFEKNQIILRPDTPLEQVFLLKNGDVRMYAISPDGDEVTLHIFREPAIFPLMLVLSNKPNVYYFESLAQTEAIQAPATAVIDFLSSEPAVLLDVTKRFSDAICGLIVRIENLAFEDSYAKIANLLIYLSKRFGTDLLLTHEDIANWLGLRRETVSRQLEKLHQRKVITLDKKHVSVIDIEQLQLHIRNQT